MRAVARGLIVVLLLCAVVAPGGFARAQEVSPTLAVQDQRLDGNMVVVDLAGAGAAAWVDIHAEAELAGNPGPVIGYAALAPGQNAYVLVPVDLARVTPVLYAVLHADAGQVGTFEFPGPDAPIQVDGKPLTVSFHVLDQASRPAPRDAGPQLAVRDQFLRGDELIVGRVVSPQAGWVDIHAEAETAGNPGAVIGYAPVGAGESTYVRVSVAPTRTTTVLYAVLHTDSGQIGHFEFPGADVPVQVDGKSVTARFQLLGQVPAASATPGTGAHVTVPAALGTAAPATPQTQAAVSTPAAVAQVTVPPTATSTLTATAQPTATATPTATASPTATTTPTATPVPTTTIAATVETPVAAAAVGTAAPTETAAQSGAATAAPEATTGLAAGGSATPTRSPLLPVTGAPSAVPLLLGAALTLLLGGLGLRLLQAGKMPGKGPDNHGH